MHRMSKKVRAAWTAAHGTAHDSLQGTAQGTETGKGKSTVQNAPQDAGKGTARDTARSTARGAPQDAGKGISGSIARRTVQGAGERGAGNPALAFAIGQEAVSLLERDVRGLGSLPREAGLYWLNTSRLDECAADDGLSDEAVDRLCAIYEFLTGGTPADLSMEDWRELAGMVNDAAEDIPVDTLTQMMSVLLDRGVLD